MTTTAGPETGSAPTGLRERRREETRAAFAHAAFELASERGLDGFTIDELAEATGLARRTFFNHFTSKEEAVAHVVVLKVREVLAVIADSHEEHGEPEEHEGDDVDDDAHVAALTCRLRTRYAGDLAATLGAVDEVTRSLLAPDVLTTLRAFAQLAERHPQLVPHLFTVENDARTQAAELLRTPEHGGLTDLQAHLVPGAVISTIAPVVGGELLLVELDGDAPGAITTDELVGQLITFLTRGIAAEHPAQPV
ncbi:transcriptional regulator, TetR family [Beutenbergia cavernae DSM 12333]|uniref:Transcriptional regulator, TetR family n=1 Tax=Beutenbergia cavernae (strain ATCC BAA-8 / DSM 12333 / CCUG 43141 / JCM 11478 / NBRC 16432 / NCIMB 13614 / HKI 0122) TaxID=471853 RepID=C5BVU2_BEUC1|nr:TetR/AcrR family transcriptional regulator [Beutenbergia cavernae]ACQ78532.1 transcriptional regulator, TetR family [Beutenbergia cavernae DSM 12333]